MLPKEGKETIDSVALPVREIRPAESSASSAKGTLVVIDRKIHEVDQPDEEEEGAAVEAKEDPAARREAKGAKPYA